MRYKGNNSFLFFLPWTIKTNNSSLQGQTGSCFQRFIENTVFVPERAFSRLDDQCVQSNGLLLVVIPKFLLSALFPAWSFVLTSCQNCGVDWACHKRRLYWLCSGKFYCAVYWLFEITNDHDCPCMVRCQYVKFFSFLVHKYLSRSIMASRQMWISFWRVYSHMLSWPHASLLHL